MAAMWRASIAVAGLLTATIAHAQPAASAARSAARLPRPYQDAVLAYLQGDFDRAAEALAQSSIDELKRAASALAEEHHEDWRLPAAAALLHIEVVLRGKASTSAATSLHVTLAQRIVDRLAPAGAQAGPASLAQIAAFQRRWYAVAASLYLEGTDPRGAGEYIDRGLRLFRRDARLRMLAGVADELRSHIANPNLHDRREILATPPGGRRTLLNAESSYRRALELDPALDEARLRLGRVISLRSDVKAARVELKTVARGSALPRLRYLAHLFLGAVAEYQNDLAGARAEYREALAIGPRCQTPYIALAFVEQALGHDGTARDLMTRYAALSPDTAADPWWFYQNGGLDEESLVWLRQQVMSPQAIQ
jgi:hypothetical protein